VLSGQAGCLTPSSAAQVSTAADIVEVTSSVFRRCRTTAHSIFACTHQQGCLHAPVTVQGWLHCVTLEGDGHLVTKPPTHCFIPL
jgi:hypothetical protein